MGKFTPPERETGFYIGADEKDELVAESTELEVVSVEQGTSQYGERFVVTINLDGEERGLSYPVAGVGSRTELLASLADYLANEKDQVPVFITLSKVKSAAGRPVNLINVVGADDDE
jgi:hypothetical protein